MTLFLTLVLVTVALFALFWGGGLVAQGYLYQQPADRLPLRAAAAALLVGLFVASWCWLDKRNPGKYDTFFEFASYTKQEFGEFTAVRWSAVGGKLKKDAQGNPTETTVKFKRQAGSKFGAFVEEGTGHPFKLNDSTMMTAAVVLKPDEGAEPIRLNADMTKADPQKDDAPKYTAERKFTEVNGSRYVTADQIGVLYVPSTGVVVLALLLNFLLFVVWFAAFWPVMRFSWGHALGGAAVFGLVTMLLLMPLLFKPNRAPKAAPEAAAARPWLTSQSRLAA